MYTYKLKIISNSKYQIYIYICIYIFAKNKFEPCILKSFVYFISPWSHASLTITFIYLSLSIYPFTFLSLLSLSSISLSFSLLIGPKLQDKAWIWCFNNWINPFHTREQMTEYANNRSTFFMAGPVGKYLPIMNHNMLQMLGTYMAWVMMWGVREQIGI